MLYHLLSPLSEHFIFFNLFRYITFRTGLAIMTSLVISFMMAPAIGKLCAERLVRGERVPYFEENGPDRFLGGIAENKETMIIG